MLELLDAPDRQRQLGLAEVHVSLATLEEVFLTVVKQVSPRLEVHYICDAQRRLAHRKCLAQFKANCQAVIQDHAG